MTEHVTTHQAEDDARNQDILIYVDGVLKPKAEAVVSVYDSGFMLGDGVWEGLRLHDKVWPFMDEHLDRLFEAAKAIDLDIGMDRDGVKEALLETQKANGMTTDAHARLMVTRGVKVRPFQHPSLSQSGPTFVIIMEHSKPSIPRPITLATVPHQRGLPMTQDPKLNSHSKLNCILACIAAQKAGADEALMLDVHGFVNTTNACNFFIVRRGEVWTSTGDYCMNGVTRQKVIDLCRALDWFGPGQYLTSPRAKPAALARFHTPEYVAAVIAAWSSASRASPINRALSAEWLFSPSRAPTIVAATPR